MNMNFDVNKIFQNRLASSMGLDKYQYIMIKVREINVSSDAEFQKTFNGFYIVRRNETWRKTYYGFSNVGTNPTFGKNNRRIETNIFDFNENIYDKEITVCFYKRLRNERKFKNMDELVAQLKDDKNTALEYINNLDVLKYKL